MRGNEKLQNIHRRSTLKILTAAAVPVLLTLLLLAAAAWLPGFTDGLYRDASRAVIHVLSRVTGWIPVSVAEVAIGLAVLSLLIALLRLLWVLISGPRRLAYLLRFVAWMLFHAAMLIFLFEAIWGLNYRAQPLAETMGLTVQARSPEELKTLNRYLIDRANALAPQLPRQSTGSASPIDFRDVAGRVADEFSKTTGRSEAPVKELLTSKWISYTRTTGIFIPYTGEANVNSDNTPADLPFVMAHEMSHRYAIAPEDEANFYAFYILEDASDPLLSYSAVLSAVLYCQNALYASDYDAFAELYASYSELVRRDLSDYSNHWKQYEGRISEISETVNNTYLIVQGEPDGVRSYGRMVDLMLAWYDAQNRVE